MMSVRIEIERLDRLSVGFPSDSALCRLAGAPWYPRRVRGHKQQATTTLQQRGPIGARLIGCNAEQGSARAGLAG